MFGDSDDESEPFEGSMSLQNAGQFCNNWVKKGRPAIFDGVIPEPGSTIERPNNYFYLDYFQLFVSNENSCVYCIQDTKGKQISIL